MLEGLIKREIKCCECGVELVCYDSSIEPDETGLLRHCKGKCPICGDHFVWKENYAYCGLSYYDTLNGYLGKER
jgi:hypothetical protein